MRRGDCSGSSTGTWPRTRQALEDGYAELVKLAMESRSRLEESRLLWQFYWNMAEEQAGSEDAYSVLVKLAVERRCRLEKSRLFWQLYRDMAEKETGSGGHLRRAGQAGRGEEKQAQGEQASLWQFYWNMA